MVLSSFIVAQSFLDLAKVEQTPLTPAKLHHLVYFAHGLHLGAYGSPLADETPTAWEFGPVVPELYNALWQFKTAHVPYDLPLVGGTNVDRKSTHYKIIEAVWRSYQSKTDLELKQIAMSDGSPWEATWSRTESRYGPIAPKVIEGYYAARLNA